MSRLIPGRDLALEESRQLGPLAAALTSALAVTDSVPFEIRMALAAPSGPAVSDVDLRSDRSTEAPSTPCATPGAHHDRVPVEQLPDNDLLGGPSINAMEAHCATPAALWTEQLAIRSRRSRDGLVLHYVPLVRALAQRMVSGLPAHVELADLVQSGVFGLIDAIERFDPARCPRFESYAALRIRGAMLDELRAQDWVPRTVRGRVRELERTQERLEARLRRGVTDRELAAELDVSVAELRATVRQVQVLSVEELDDAVIGRSATSESLVDDTPPDPMTVVQHRETRRQLSDAVALLGERDRAVVRMYYLENRTLAEIGRCLGVTESRVCQLHSRLVGRLRGRLEELAAG